MAPGTTAGPASMRRHDLDNLRSFLTGLVVVHHTALAYGGPGQLVFQSRLLPAGFESPALLGFAAVNQSFFMALFFWMSGRMSAQSLEQLDAAAAADIDADADADAEKHGLVDEESRIARVLARSRGSGGRWEFVCSKAKRLLLPALVYTAAVAPVISILSMEVWSWETLGEHLWTYYRTLKGVRGPVWYTATLFMFDTVAALVKPSSVRSQQAREKRGGKTPGLPSYQMLGRWGWAPVAAASFLVRLRYPILGKGFGPTGIQLGFAPQYVLAYSMGHVSHHCGEQWISGLFSPGHREDATSLHLHPTEKHEQTQGLRPRRRTRRTGIKTAVLISLATLPLCALPDYLMSGGGGGGGGGEDWLPRALARFPGGWSATAAAYVAWNELALALIGPALMEHFYDEHGAPATSWLWQPRYSYAAFLVHMAVSVPVELAVDAAVSAATRDGWMGSAAWLAVGPVVLTGVVGAVNTVASFAVGRAFRDGVPGMRRIV